MPKGKNKKYSKKQMKIARMAAPFDKITGADFAMLKKKSCLLYTSPSPRDRTRSRMPSSA